MANSTFLALGAIIQEFRVGGRNIVQSFPTAELYEKYNSAYFGETIGRVANRIANAKVNSLNGKSYSLTANNGPNTLHGGRRGFGKRHFEGPTPTVRHGQDAIQFKYLSKDGEEGLPGDLELRVWYTQRREAEVEVLEIEYEAELVGDADVSETAVNITNHNYFNLAGTTSIAGSTFKLSTNQYLEVDDTGIPTGEIKAYPGIESNTEYELGQQQPDPDDCFVVDTDPSTIPIDTRSRTLKLLGHFRESKDGGINLEVHSTEPAFQYYTGKYIDVPAIPDAGLPSRDPRCGFCVEPSRYVNAVNVDDWRNMVILRRGEIYGSRSMYRAWVDRA